MGAIISLEAFRQRNSHNNKNEIEVFKHYLHECGLLNEYKQCCICGWCKSDMTLTFLTPRSWGGGYTISNILPFCPNHEMQFEAMNLSDNELFKVQKFLWTICNKMGHFNN